MHLFLRFLLFTKSAALFRVSFCRRNSWNLSGSEDDSVSDFESESERPLNSRRPAAAAAAANRRPANKAVGNKARPAAPAKRTIRKNKYASSDESGSDYSEEERRKYGGGG